MASAYTGHGAYVSLWEEGTWGTDARGSGTQRTYDLESFAGGGLQYNREPIPALASASRTTRGHFLASVVADPEVTLFCCFKSMGLFYKHALGGTPSTTGASAPYTHTVLSAMTLPVGLTVEVNLGNSGESYVYVGAKIASMTIDLVAADVVRVKLKLMAKTATRDSSPTAASFVAGRDMQANHAGFTSLTWGSLTAWTDIVRKVTLTVNNSLARRQNLGSAYTAEPTFGGFAEFTADVELDYQTGGAVLTAIAADDGSAADAVLLLTDPTDNDNTIEVTLHGAFVTTSKLGEIAGPSIMVDTLTLRGQSHGSDAGIAIVYTNDASAALT